jgi:signal transduction histidine kinase
MKFTATTASHSLARYQLFSRLLTAPSGEKIERLLKSIVEVFDLAEAGLCWPVIGKPQLLGSSGDINPNSIPKWDPDALIRLAGAKSSEEYLPDPDYQNRLLIPIIIESRRNGVFWATTSHCVPTEDSDALVVVAQCLAKNSAVLERIGACHDQMRVVHRLQDAASIGGKIAHDFDNIFTGVVGFAEMVQSLLQPGSLPHQYVAEIASAGNRGILFTQQLHQLSRSGLARPLPTAVASILAREETRVRKATSNVRFQFPAPNDLPAVAMDAGALQIILGHLLDNAVEASPANGLVRVTASLIELSDVEAREFLGASTAGPFVEICVGDEGPGIRDEHRKKLFVEPFFTTKVRHRGLGLPVVYRILHAHRGGIRFDSAPGRGSVFQMVLPLAAARSSEQAVAPLETKRLPGGNAS